MTPMRMPEPVTYADRRHWYEVGAMLANVEPKPAPYIAFWDDFTGMEVPYTIGVVPIAMLATLIKGMWEPFFTLLLLAIATYGCRIGAMSLVASLDS